jgi:hypothetical protein
LSTEPKLNSVQASHKSNSQAAMRR